MNNIISLNKNQTVVNKLNAVLNIAKNVRHQMVELATYHGNDVDLTTYCAVSSWLLRKESIKNNLFPALILGHFNIKGRHPDSDWCNHAWIRYCGKIIDITATQFSTFNIKFNDIHITSNADKMYNAISIIQKDVNSRLNGRWPTSQNPLHPSSYLKDLEKLSKRFDVDILDKTG